jgi:hypothetical protein
MVSRNMLFMAKFRANILQFLFAQRRLKHHTMLRFSALKALILFLGFMNAHAHAANAEKLL